MSNFISTTEIWKDIPGYEDVYKISSFGNVYSYSTERILKPTLKKEKGYLKVGLYHNYRNRSCEIHRMVALTFFGVRPKGFVTDHIDGNKLNNRLDNLQYITSRANVIKGNVCMNKSSGYVGVNKSRNMWRARISLDGKKISIGTFKTELQAAKAYDRMWIKCG